jgi:hypothetical protein
MSNETMRTAINFERIIKEWSLIWLRQTFYLQWKLLNLLLTKWSDGNKTSC